MRRVYGKLKKHPIPVVRDIPGRAVSWACVLREPEGKFRVWYNSMYGVSAHEMATAGVWGRGSEFGFFPERMEGAIPDTQTCVVSYAESDDGFKWRKPSLGLFEWQGSKDNNIALDGSRAAEQFNRCLTNMDQPSVIKDDADPDPEKPAYLCSGRIDGTLNVGTIRLDGFAAMAVDEDASTRSGKPGMLVTQPATVQSPQLEINIEGHHGSAKVALLDERGRVVPGYELENCLPIAEDAVRAVVQWNDQADVSALQGKRICLLVQMSAGRLYAFRM